ncbi:MAG: septation protein IspZ [Luminiphilus sp.]|nr:septation protein IspZ [Luminiphilus sp.]
MKQLLEFIPVVLFIGVYFLLDGETVSVGAWFHTFDGIYSATAVLMMSTTVCWIIASVMQRKNDRRLMWMTLLIVPMGAATLILKNPIFIQWKPTVFNWGLAIVVLGFQLLGKQTLIERIMGSQITLPRAIWVRINMLWFANFTIVGAANLYVAFNYSEAFWMLYKLYSGLGFTVLASVLTIVVAFPYLKADELDGNSRPAEGPQ